MAKLVSTNPADDSVIGEVEVSTDKEITEAVAKARDGFPKWRETPLAERIGIFKQLRNLLEKNVEELAALESREIGKPIRESLVSCRGNVKRIEWHIEHAPRLLALQVLEETDEHHTEIVREPYGVVAAIVPWNFPVSNFFIPALPALLSGNTLILKHSEECPIVSKRLAEIADEAGFPKGVCQVLFGGREVGERLLNESVQFVYFTGSTRAGKEIFKKTAEKFIPSVLEMGGSSPGIILDDVDIDAAARSAYNERFRNCGQVCTALKRLFIHEKIFKTVIERLREYAEKEIIGDPLDPKTTLGPLVAKRQLELLETQVADAKEKRAQILTGGSRPEGMRGSFYLPTLITDVTSAMRVMQEEVFGPVLPIVPFSNDEEAVRLANDTPYGLGAFVYGTDISRAERIASQLQAGEVHINSAQKGRYAPIGGYKNSGIGRADGAFGYQAMTQMKTIARPR